MGAVNRPKGIVWRLDDYGRRIAVLEKKVARLLRSGGGGTEGPPGPPGPAGPAASVATDSIFDAKGDIPVGTGPDAAVRLPVGSNGQVLTADSGETTGTKWATPTTGIPTSIVDAKGDLIAASADDTPARLAVGSNGQVLTADSGQTLGVKWDTPATGIPATLLDAKGDLIVASANDTAARLAVGSNGQVLTADSGETTGAKWTTPIDAEQVRDIIGTALVEGSYIDITVDDGGDTITITKGPAVINAQTGTSYTLVIGDAIKFITMSNASASTLTVPPNSSVAFPVGTTIEGAQLGAGQVTLTPGSGVTINATPGLKIAAQYGSFGLIKTATDTWLAVGRLAA